jgi:U3 small nucleolar RNA-associated protein 14
LQYLISTTTDVAIAARCRYSLMPQAGKASNKRAPPKRGKGNDDAASGSASKWFNPNMDEDIDDDLAFDSDDEKKYGHFFKKAGGKQAIGHSGKGDEDAGDEDFADDMSDDSRDEIDISELLDSKEERQLAAAERRQVRRLETETSTLNTPSDKKAGPATGRGRKGRLTDEAESLLLAPQARTSTATLHELSAAAKGSIADAGALARLDALKSTQGLIGRELSEQERDLMDRAMARDATKADMEKWRAFITEQRRTRTVQFPLKAPNQNPMATTLSGVAAFHQERYARLRNQQQQQGDQEAAQPISQPTSVVLSMAAKMADLLGKSGLGTTKEHKRIEREAAGTAAAAGGVPAFADQAGYLQVPDGEDQSGGDKGEKPEGPSMSYVAKLKALVGYDIQKRKRFNKIKSKTYRRILRKEQERERELKQRALELIDPEKARKKAQERMDKMRAEERATQRHKNTSKWVRHVKHMSKFDDNVKDALSEQDVLRRRLMAKTDEDAAQEIVEAVNEDDESEEEERRVDELLAGARHHGVSALWDDAADDSDAEALDDVDGDEKRAKLRKARKELESMDFMKRAKERHREHLKTETTELLEDVRRYKAGLAPLGRAPDDEDSDDAEREETRRVLADERGDALDVAGLRAKREKAAAAKAKAVAEAEAAEARRLASLKSTAAGSGRKTFTGPGGDVSATGGKQAHVDVELGRRAGIVAGEGTALTQAQRRAEEVAQQAAAEAAAKKKAPTKMTKRRQAAEIEDDAVLDEGAADEDAVMTASHRRVGGKASQSAKDEAAPPTPAAAAAAGAATDRKAKRARDEGQQPVVATASAKPPNGKTRDGPELSHDYLVARAFARDDIDQDFAAAKAAQVEAAMKPEDPNASLPGWGEWGGENEHLNRKHKERVSGLNLARNIERSALAASRADAKLEHAIINHDVGMVADKHTLHIVPRPYDSAVQYQHATRQPLGPEFNSVRTFQDSVQPRVLTKKGIAIDPVDLTSGIHKKAQTARRKDLGAKEGETDLADMALLPDQKARREAAKKAAVDQKAKLTAARAKAKADRTPAKKKHSGGGRDSRR